MAEARRPPWSPGLCHVLLAKRSLTGLRLPACRRRNHTMVWMNSIRKACYTSAVALVLAASPLVLAFPAVAEPCGPAGLLPVKFCPPSPTPGPPPASPAPVSPAPGPPRPGSPAPSPTGAVPAPTPSKTPSAGQPVQPAQPAPGPATPTSGSDDPTAGQGNATQPPATRVPATATAGPSTSPSPDAGQGPGLSPEQPLDVAASPGVQGPDGQIGIAGSLLAAGGLLIVLSAAIGLRRPASP